jgi:hypothetical protein
MHFDRAIPTDCYDGSILTAVADIGYLALLVSLLLSLLIILAVCLYLVLLLTLPPFTFGQRQIKL